MASLSRQRAIHTPKIPVKKSTNIRCNYHTLDSGVTVLILRLLPASINEFAKFSTQVVILPAAQDIWLEMLNADYLYRDWNVEHNRVNTSNAFYNRGDWLVGFVSQERGIKDIEITNF